MNRIMLSLLAFVLCATSCNKSDDAGKLVTISATFPEGEFRPSDAMSVYCGSSSSVFKARSVAGSASAEFEGRIAVSGTSRISAVYPAFPASGDNPCVISIGEQKLGDDLAMATASVGSPDYSAPVKMTLKTMTGKGLLLITNKTDMPLRLASARVEGSRMFYSKCDFATSATKNIFTESSVTVMADDKTLETGKVTEIPFYLFPGEVAESRVFLTLDLKDGAGKVYQVKTRVNFARPKAGEESSLSMDVVDDLLDDSPKNYTIVYPKSLTGAALQGIKAIPAVIMDKAGINVSCVSDDNPESDYEILYGETNREAGKSITCPRDAYVIRYKDKKLVVKGSSDDQMIAALYGLERDILSNPEYVQPGRLKLSLDIDIRKETGETLAMRHMVRDLYDFTIKESLLKTFYGDSPATVAQGACTDGTYGYYGFRNGAESVCIIYKYRLSDHVKVGQVQLDLTACGGYSHVNDLVYEPESDLIYVSTWSNANGSPKCLLRVNASTMTQVTPVSGTTHSPTALAYNTREKIFMTRSGANVYVSNPGFTSTRVVNSAYEKYGYTNQGGGGDDLYCYFPVNNGTDSQLLTFDWTGRQLWNIQINNKTESESIFVVDDKYYWWCYASSSGRLYLLKPEMRFTPGFKGGWSDIPSPALK